MRLPHSQVENLFFICMLLRRRVVLFTCSVSSSSSSAQPANSIRSHFPAQRWRLPLADGDVICWCREEINDVIIFSFTGNTWTGKVASTDLWTSSLDQGLISRTLSSSLLECFVFCLVCWVHVLNFAGFFFFLYCWYYMPKCLYIVYMYCMNILPFNKNFLFDVVAFFFLILELFYCILHKFIQSQLLVYIHTLPFSKGHPSDKDNNCNHLTGVTCSVPIY